MVSAMVALTTYLITSNLTISHKFEIYTIHCIASYSNRLNTSVPDGRAPLGEDESLSRSASDSSVSIPAVGLNK